MIIFHLQKKSLHLAERNFQLRKTYAEIRKIMKIITKATISREKLASVMSSSCNVVSGERKWQ